MSNSAPYTNTMREGNQRDVTTKRGKRRVLEHTWWERHLQGLIVESIYTNNGLDRHIQLSSCIASKKIHIDWSDYGRLVLLSAQFSCLRTFFEAPQKSTYRSFHARDYSSSRQRLSGVDKERKASEAHYQRYRRGRIVEKVSLPADITLPNGNFFVNEYLPQEAEEGISVSEVADDEDHLYELMSKEIRLATSRSDPRTRTDRKERRQKGFTVQIDVMISAYMDWSYRTKDAGLEGAMPSPNPRDVLAEGTRTVIVIDIFRTTEVTYTLLAIDKTVAAALVRQGMVPCAPFSPKYAVSIRALELYKNLHSRAPDTTIQSFLKGIQDMQGHQYRKAYHTPFSVVFDVYIEILNGSCVSAGENDILATSVVDSAN